MSKIKSIGLAATLFLGTLSTSSWAGLMTFGDGPKTAAGGYSENGLLIGGASVDRILDWDTRGTVSNPSGEREFLFNVADGTYVFSLVSGGTFDLLSLTVEQHFPFQASGSTRFTASSGSTSIDNRALGSVSFGNLFLGVSEVSFFAERVLGNTQASGGSNVIIDDVVFEINGSVSTPVSSPATLTLFGLGLAGLGWSRRKKA